MTSLLFQDHHYGMLLYLPVTPISSAYTTKIASYVYGQTVKKMRPNDHFTLTFNTHQQDSSFLRWEEKKGKIDKGLVSECIKPGFLA